MRGYGFTHKFYTDEKRITKDKDVFCGLTINGEE
jgi:hypothetical protein